MSNSLKIGELAKRTGCLVETIRYYEREGLLPEPARSEGNYRLYTDIHVEFFSRLEAQQRVQCDRRMLSTGTVACKRLINDPFPRHAQSRMAKPIPSHGRRQAFTSRVGSSNIDSRFLSRR